VNAGSFAGTRHFDAHASVIQSSRTKSRRHPRAGHRQESLKSKSLLVPVPRTTTANKRVQRGSSVPEGRNPWTRMDALSGNENGDLLLRKTSASFLQNKVRRRKCEVHHKIDLVKQRKR
jgi:hypothetical protein